MVISVRRIAIRRLGRSLGVGAMALYTYVPGKAELLDLMLDRVYAEMPRDAWPADCRERVTELARDNRALYEAHPWAAGSAHGGAYSAEHAWEFGFERVLDGLAALIDRPR
jgi:AcrR family transcriptional regulator